MIQRRSDLLLCQDISLEERIKIADELINDTKESLKNLPEVAYPKEHEFYRMQLHTLELTRQQLKDALFEQVIFTPKMEE